MARSSLATSTRSRLVFLCHSSPDKDVVREIYKRLRESGVSPWLDEEDLEAGQDWEYEIRSAVKRAAVVIVCLSRNSLSREGFVHREIKLALDVADEKPEGTVFIIPVRLEECSVPERLQRWHRVDYFDPNGFEKLLRSLKAQEHRRQEQSGPVYVDRIDRGVDGSLQTGTNAPVTVPQYQAASTRKAFVKRWWVMMVLLVLLLSAIIIIGRYYFHGMTGQPRETVSLPITPGQPVYGSVHPLMILQEGPEKNWGIKYEMNGEYALSGDHVTVKIKAGFVKLGNNTSPEVRLRSINLGLCSASPTGQWDIYPHDFFPSTSLQFKDAVVTRDKGYQVEPHEFALPLPPNADLGDLWVCSFLWSNVGGNFPAHEQYRNTLRR